MKCRYCGKEEAIGGVFCTACSGTRPDKLTTAQYLGAMHKVRHLIGSGTPIGLDDSDVVGDKHNHCAWGMCTNNKDVWDRPELHIWPMDFIEGGRIAPLRRPSKCPLDTRKEDTLYGCFYECLAFRPPAGFTLTREYALQLYDQEIHKLSQTELKNNRKEVSP